MNTSLTWDVPEDEIITLATPSESSNQWSLPAPSMPPAKEELAYPPQPRSFVSNDARMKEQSQLRSRDSLSENVVERATVSGLATLNITPETPSKQVPANAAPPSLDSDFKMAEKRTSVSRNEGDNVSRAKNRDARGGQVHATRRTTMHSDDARVSHRQSSSPAVPASPTSVPEHSFTAFGAPPVVTSPALSCGGTDDGFGVASLAHSSVNGSVQPETRPTERQMQPEAVPQSSKLYFPTMPPPMSIPDLTWNVPETEIVTLEPIATANTASQTKGFKTLESTKVEPKKPVHEPSQSNVSPPPKITSRRPNNETLPPVEPLLASTNSTTKGSGTNLASSSHSSSQSIPHVSVTPISLARGSGGPFQHVLIVSGVEGKLHLLNELALTHNARAIIHTGNFGFYDAQSIPRLPISDLRRVAQRELGLEAVAKMTDAAVIALVSEQSLLSELSGYCHGKKRLNVPVYVVSGQYEDHAVVEKLRKGVYHVPNLYILDHRHSYAISSEQLTLRLFGIGGAFSYSQLFDVGSGNDYICGGQGTVWVSMCQLGELLELAEQYDEPLEIRVFVTQSSPSRDPLVHSIARQLNADYTVSSSAITTGCSVYNYKAVHSEASLAASVKACKTDIKSLWDQIYFVTNEKFTETRRNYCDRVLVCLEKAASDPLVPSCTSITVGSIHGGHASLNLGTDRLIVQSWSQHALHRAATKPPGIEDASQNETCTVAPLMSSPAMPIPPVEVRLERPRASKATSDAEIAAMLPSSTSRVVGDVRNELNDAFYIDRASADKRAELSLFISNLPYEVSGAELDSTFFSNYDIDCIEFVGTHNTNVVVVFKHVKDVIQACEDLRHATFNGREIRVRRDRRFEAREQ